MIYMTLVFSVLTCNLTGSYKHFGGTPRLILSLSGDSLLQQT